MRIPNYSHLIRLWHRPTSSNLSITKPTFFSRNIHYNSRRRQRRHLTGQALALVSIPFEPFPFAPLPTPTTIPSDPKGKGKARSRSDDVDVTSLCVPYTSSISLRRLQDHLGTEKVSGHSLLRLIISILDMVPPPTNDVRQRGRRWKISIYRKADYDQARGLSEDSELIPNSTDMLCAELLKSEVKLERTENNVYRMLKAISKRARRGSASRTLQAVERLLEEVVQLDKSRVDPTNVRSRSINTILEHSIILRTRMGNWSAIWNERQSILNLLRYQKRQGLLQLSQSDKWELDTILLKSLIGTCAATFSSRTRTKSTIQKLNIGANNQFLAGVNMLYKEIEDIYGEVSDEWLNRVVLVLARSVEPGIWSRGSHLSQHEYRAQLPLIKRAEELFKVHARRSEGQKSLGFTSLVYTMMDLHINLLHHCRLWVEKAARGTMANQIHKHWSSIGELTAILSEQENLETNEMMLDSPTTMDQLRSRAKIAHTRIKLQLLEGDFEAAIRTLEGVLGSIGPDENYSYILDDGQSTLMERRRMTSKAMLTTRRLMRGAFISIVIHLSGCIREVQMRGVSSLSQLATKSVRTGVWDPWPLRGHPNARRHQPLSIRMKPIDPVSDLCSLFSRMMGMIRPIQTLRRNQPVIVADGVTSSVYWSVVEQLAESSKAMRSRIQVLRDLDEAQTVTKGSNHGAFKKFFSRELFGGAKYIWPLFANKEEKEMIVPRLRHLLYDLFLPSKVQRKVWTSARKALDQTFQEGMIESEADIWKVFNDAAEEARLGSRTAINKDDARESMQWSSRPKRPKYKAREERRKSLRW